MYGKSDKYTLFNTERTENPIKTKNVPTTNDPIGKKEAFSIVSELFKELSPTQFLLYGSIAKSLLTDEDKPAFGDIDLVVACPLELAAERLREVLDKLGIKYNNESYREGNFTLLIDDKQYGLQLIDSDNSKKAYPRDFIEFHENQFSEFESINTEDGSVFPCVPLKNFADPDGPGFQFKNHPKTSYYKDKPMTNTISAFNF